MFLGILKLCMAAFCFLPMIGFCEEAKNEKLNEFIRKFHLSAYKNETQGSLLGFAALNSDNDTASLLLLKNADPNKKDANTETPFSIAIEKGNFSLVEKMLSFKADPNQIVDNVQDGCMPKAIPYPNAEVQCPKDSYSVLEIAVKNKQKEIAKLLLDNGAKVNYTSKLGYQPIHLAVRQKDLDLVRLLLEKGADPNAKDGWGYYPLHYTAFVEEGKKASDIANALIEYGADVNKQVDAPIAKFTALHLAARNGRADLTQTLLENKADVKIFDAYGCTPLWSAVNCDIESRDIVKNLLRSRADPNEISPMKKNEEKDLLYLDSPLSLAARKGKLETLSILLENGANPNIIDGNGNTALLVAVETGNREAAVLLIQQGANPGLRSSEKPSPIEKASSQNNPDLFDLLIKAEANQILN